MLYKANYRQRFRNTLNKIKPITTNTTKELVQIPNAEMVKLTGKIHRCVRNISNSVRWEQNKREDVKDSKCGVGNVRENQTHRQISLFNKDKTNHREFNVPLPPQTLEAMNIHVLYLTPEKKEYYSTSYLFPMEVLSVTSLVVTVVV